MHWLTVLKNCFKYYKGCEACQKFGKVQAPPASMLHPIVKQWLFRGWGLDFVCVWGGGGGPIHPSSTKGHHFVLVATNYFTKWVEAVPLRNMTYKEIIHFVLEPIIY
jgi:hypothetical protein